MPQFLFRDKSKCELGLHYLRETKIFEVYFYLKSEESEKLIRNLKSFNKLPYHCALTTFILPTLFEMLNTWILFPLGKRIVTQSVKTCFGLLHHSNIRIVCSKCHHWSPFSARQVACRASFYRIHGNIIFLSMPGCPKWSLPLIFATQILYKFLISVIWLCTNNTNNNYNKTVSSPFVQHSEKKVMMLQLFIFFAVLLRAC